MLWDAGVTHFDVASIAEVRLVRETCCPKRRCASCTRSRPPSADREAYFEHGVRTFSLDSHEELEKIVEATDEAGSRRPTCRCACGCACHPNIRS
jgi:ornithine decarboxylase